MLDPTAQPMSSAFTFTLGLPVELAEMEAVLGRALADRQLRLVSVVPTPPTQPPVEQPQKN